MNGEFIANPTHTQREDSDLDLVYVGSKNEVIMIEGDAKELPEAEFVKALHFAQAAVQPLIAAQEQLAAVAGKKKREFTPVLAKDELLEVAYAVAGEPHRSRSLSTHEDRPRQGRGSSAG